ncbi:MAG: hypothetical protein KatS3mg111_1701 [Pirellulaceae bacterium]|nr:MAG: hypothetical protein KatS3mg111_1701 [Pirellulaceae bacterium]
MSTFFDLRITNHRFVELSPHNDWEGIKCPKNPGHQRAGRRITPLRIDILSNRITDFSSTLLSDVVITDIALQKLREAGLTGFRVEPVVIDSIAKRVDRSRIPKLWEFVVVGDGGFAHPDSGITLKRTCDACGLRRYSAFEHGIIVDEDAYDGSDFFTVREYPKHILVNERAKTVIESSGLTGVDFIDASQLKWPDGVVKP